jgi:hypothetical protein
LKRRAPFYASDWTEGVKPRNWERVVGATVRMFFLNLFVFFLFFSLPLAESPYTALNSMPCLAYIIDMYVRTDGNYGVNEGILSSAIAALSFSLLSVQPLTIVGVTGLINLFNYTSFDILKGYEVDYLQFMGWVLLCVLFSIFLRFPHSVFSSLTCPTNASSASPSWSAITHWLVAILNLADYTRFVTEMTSETFGLCALPLL